MKSAERTECGRRGCSPLIESRRRSGHRAIHLIILEISGPVRPSGRSWLVLPGDIS
jgi:hypothetical protein